MSWINDDPGGSFIQVYKEIRAGDTLHYMLWAQAKDGGGFEYFIMKHLNELDTPTQITHGIHPTLEGAKTLCELKYREYVIGLSAL